MGGFVFRLQKVLDHRMRVEDVKKQEFITARLAYLKERERLDALVDELEKWKHKDMSKSRAIFTYIARNNYLMLLSERIDEQGKRVREKDALMGKKKDEYQESQKARKVVEKLKENAYRDYKIDTDRIEQKMNDEFGLYGFTRK